VAGRSDNGTGVLADSINGTALKVTGKAAFSRSGKATVQAGTSAVTVAGVPLTSASLILATVQQSGGAYVKSAVPDVANSRFRINLNKAPTVDVAVAWFIVN